MPTTSLSTPLSLYSIPAAWLTAFFPVILKTAAITKLKGFNNDSKIPPEAAQRIERMEGAHFNGNENFPLWAAAVCVLSAVPSIRASFNLNSKCLRTCVVQLHLYKPEDALTELLEIALPLYLLISAATKLAIQQNAELTLRTDDMGAALSRLRLIYRTFKSISDSFSVLSQRISLDPGLPHPHPSRSYWLEPSSPLNARPASPPLPEYADIVIIGSGISGAAIARTLLDSSDKEQPLRVVMLEARDVCSGATGRNGGHISPNTYQDYSELAAKYGPSAAREIIRFRLAHIPALLEVAADEGLLHASQARIVEQFDAYLQDSLYQRAKGALDGYLTACPERRGKHTVCGDKSALKELQLSLRVAGCISQTGGALHPYRLITGILARLLAVHPEQYCPNDFPSFRLFINTPCTDISLAADGSSYRITTPKGMLGAAHVVHATNAWAAHLLPGMRRKIVPARMYMTAQRPGCVLGQTAAASAPWTGKRAFVFYPSASMTVFDYLTQQPPAGGVKDSSSSHSTEEGSISTIDVANPVSAGELMFGGGASIGGRAEAALLDNVGVTDDSQTDFDVTAYLGGALERYFEPGWGAEGGTCATAEKETDAGKVEEGEWAAGRVKAAWSGLMGISADGQPWVGRVPGSVSGRGEPRNQSTASANVGKSSLASPGEWIAAGFTGEGMTHAWLAGVALAKMVLGDANGLETAPDAAPLPPQFVITEKRWREANIEELLAD
ncbi:FAD dependent oxidoreductase-domain-containing protein [Mycena galopus ATCC 62051]|nr:FAD dependent oxidoreductase-domain-containing protein [Mycena galopus ATCC 62051]